MTVSDQAPLTVYLMVVLGVAAVSTAAAIGVLAAALRTWSTNRRDRMHLELRRGRVGRGTPQDPGAALVPDDASGALSPDRR